MRWFAPLTGTEVWHGVMVIVEEATQRSNGEAVCGCQLTPLGANPRYLKVNKKPRHYYNGNSTFLRPDNSHDPTVLTDSSCQCIWGTLNFKTKHQIMSDHVRSC